MRVAALYDIHGNLPALGAVLREVRDDDIDEMVIGGDVFPAPMSRACLDDVDLAARSVRASGHPGANQFVARNVLRPPAEREMLDAFTVAGLA